MRDNGSVFLSSVAVMQTQKPTTRKQMHSSATAENNRVQAAAEAELSARAATEREKRETEGRSSVFY